MRTPLGALIGAASLLLAACGGPSVLVVGETPRPPDPPVRLLVVDASGGPVPGAEVWSGGERHPVEETGMVEIGWEGGPVALVARAPGFHPAEIEWELRPVGLERVVLTPVVLQGRVLAEDGTPLPGARVGLAGEEATTGTEGRFRISPAPAGELVVSRPGWERASRLWAGERDATVEVTLRPRRIRALYASGPAAADPDTWAALLELAREAGVTGMVVDLKDSSGTVYYPSSVPTAREAGAVRPALDAEATVADLRAAGLYAVARLVAFEDPVVAEAIPELAVWDTGREAPWRNDGGRAWIDPTDPAARAYLVELAVEACRLGFDEVQFDYVRFPTDGPLGRARFDGGSDTEVRVGTIVGFLSEARAALHEEGCALAADIFGFMTSAVDDGGIGQRFEEMVAAVDVMSPMIYPSHYRDGWFGFSIPNDHPREVAARALDDALARMDGTTILRPWLQGFSFGPGIGYGPAQIRPQLEEAEARGLGWMLWNAGSRFHPASIPSDQE